MRIHRRATQIVKLDNSVCTRVRVSSFINKQFTLYKYRGEITCYIKKHQRIRTLIGIDITNLIKRNQV